MKQYSCHLLVVFVVLVLAVPAMAQYDSMGQPLDKPDKPPTTDAVSPSEKIKWYDGWIVDGKNPYDEQARHGLGTITAKSTNPELQFPFNLRVLLVKKELYDALQVGQSIYVGVYPGRIPVAGVALADSSLPDRGLSRYDYTSYDPVDTSYQK